MPQQWRCRAVWPALRQPSHGARSSVTGWQRCGQLVRTCPRRHRVIGQVVHVLKSAAAILEFVGRVFFVTAGGWALVWRSFWLFFFCCGRRRLPFASVGETRRTGLLGPPIHGQVYVVALRNKDRVARKIALTRCAKDCAVLLSDINLSCFCF